MKANSRIEPRASLIIQRMRRALAVLLVLGAVVPAAAMEMQPSGTIESNAVEGTVLDTTATLEDYVSYALSNNPLLKAYMDNSSAAWQVPTQRRSLPDPVLSYGYFARNVETRVGPQEDSWILSQKFPFPGKLSLKGDIAAKDAEIADKLYEEKALDLIDQVKKTYYEYYQIYQDIRVLKQEKQVIRYMQDVAQIKYASGQVNQQDVLKAQLALSNLEDKLTMLERRLTTTITRFNRLLNREPLAPLAKPKADFLEAELGKVEQLYKEAETNRPELKSAEIAIEKAKKAKSLAKREYFPDLTLSMQYVRVGERPLPTLEENGKDAVLFKASLNLPIWIQKRRAGVREAEAREALARHRRESVLTSIRSEVQDAYTKVQTARELVDLYEHVILPQAEQTFAASEAGYRTGEIDFLNYLDSERALLALRRAYFGVVADLGKQIADFERTVGSALKNTVR
jgi:outer membrane protein TolC